MKKTVSRAICLGLSMLTAFSLVSCKKKKAYDRDSRPVVFASEALDGNFNPFFATSGPDTEIASMTQVGLLSTNAQGKVVCGEDEPSVALDFKKEKINGDEFTEYKFIIKKGIKFSDGEELTIKDVLFNLYVYLDPAYTGSATMYSTDIVGLAEYRAQQEGATSDDNFDATYEAEANDRLSNLIAYLMDNPDKYGEVKDEALAIADVELFKEYHLATLQSDWALCQDLEPYEDEYSFTKTWEVYFYEEGLITRETVQGEYQKDENGKWLTNAADFADEMAGKTGEELKAYAINRVYEADTNAPISMGNAIMRSFTTQNKLWEYFKSDARLSATEDGLVVPNISGITTGKTSTYFNGKSLGGEYDTLTIKINGIDPKAEYNFGFAVAPMHYYSGTFGEVDYIATADPAKNQFGVKWSDPEFFQDVLQAPEKNAKPVGAGVYQASDRDGNKGKDVKGDKFHEAEWVYFVRNDNFETVGKGIKNAKIKYLRYKIVASDALLQALQSGDIDIGEPNATANNLTAISDSKNLAQKSVNTNGYGYVGINPRYVPDVQVRRAIMMAMNTSDAINYYTEGSASQVYRSMSKESWLWDYWQNMDFTGEKSPFEPYYAQATTKEQIQDVVADAGWYPNSNGKLTKDGKTLKLTFTIAGATTDHPAYQMFTQAEYWLEQAGFDITVVTDVQALKKLARGELAVWAAAWSSTIDPDMYQVYHIDSTASSTKNWGYDWMKQHRSDYAYELDIVENKLSPLIDNGRETDNEQTRAEIYKEALDWVMELAVELPSYQRTDCVAYNKKVISVKSLNNKPTAYAGVIDKVWELDYN